MTKRITILMILTMLFQLPAFAQNASTTIPTPNAAVGYLMAIGWMNPESEKVMTEFGNTETLADLEKLSPDAKHYITKTSLNTVIHWLVQGAACEHCQFGYEHTWQPDEPVPPFKRLRELSRVARAFGLEQLRDGKAAEALQTFRAIFRLGGHLEVDGPLISGMVGLAIKKIAIKGFGELITKGKDEKVIASAREFLKAQPSATLATKTSLAGEKKYMAAALQLMKNSQSSPAELASDWGDGELRSWLPKNRGKKEYVTLPSPPVSALKACLANQRVLLGAVEMLCMDFSPMPASLTVNVIPEFLVTSQYLKKFPTCQDGGKYELTMIKEGEYEWRCTIHPTPDASGKTISQPPPSAPPAEILAEIEEFQKFMKSSEFDEMIVEALAMLDVAMAFDPYAPEYTAKLEAFDKKIETSTNTVILKAMPNIRKIFEQQIELDDVIKKLLEK